MLLLITSCRAAAQMPGPPPALSRKKALGDADKQATLEAARAVAGLSDERKYGMRRQAQQPPAEEELAAAREAEALQAEADERAREAAAEDELVNMPAHAATAPLLRSDLHHCAHCALRKEDNSPAAPGGEQRGAASPLQRPGSLF